MIKSYNRPQIIKFKGTNGVNPEARGAVPGQQNSRQPSDTAESSKTFPPLPGRPAFLETPLNPEAKQFLLAPPPLSPTSPNPALHSLYPDLPDLENEYFIPGLNEMLKHQTDSVALFSEVPKHALYKLDEIGNILVRFPNGEILEKHAQNEINLYNKNISQAIDDKTQAYVLYDDETLKIINKTHPYETKIKYPKDSEIDETLIYDEGSIVTSYKNGLTEKLFLKGHNNIGIKDGAKSTLIYGNSGDIRITYPNGTIKSFFNKDKSIQTVYPDTPDIKEEKTVYYLDNKSLVVYYKNGEKSSLFNNNEDKNKNSIKTVYPNKSKIKETIDFFNTGSFMTKFKNGFIKTTFNDANTGKVFYIRTQFPKEYEINETVKYLTGNSFLRFYKSGLTIRETPEDHLCVALTKDLKGKKKIYLWKKLSDEWTDLDSNYYTFLKDDKDGFKIPFKKGDIIFTPSNIEYTKVNDKGDFADIAKKYKDKFANILRSKVQEKYPPLQEDRFTEIFAQCKASTSSFLSDIDNQTKYKVNESGNLAINFPDGITIKKDQNNNISIPSASVIKKTSDKNKTTELYDNGISVVLLNDNENIEITYPKDSNKTNTTINIKDKTIKTTYKNNSIETFSLRSFNTKIIYPNTKDTDKVHTIIYGYKEATKGKKYAETNYKNGKLKTLFTKDNSKQNCVRTKYPYDYDVQETLDYFNSNNVVIIKKNGCNKTIKNDVCITTPENKGLKVASFINKKGEQQDFLWEKLDGKWTELEEKPEINKLLLLNETGSKKEPLASGTIIFKTPEGHFIEVNEQLNVKDFNFLAPIFMKQYKAQQKAKH